MKQITSVQPLKPNETGTPTETRNKHASWSIHWQTLGYQPKVLWIRPFKLAWTTCTLYSPRDITSSEVSHSVRVCLTIVSIQCFSRVIVQLQPPLRPPTTLPINTSLALALRGREVHWVLRLSLPKFKLHLVLKRARACMKRSVTGAHLACVDFLHP